MAETLKHRLSNTGILQTTTYFSEIPLNQEGYYSVFLDGNGDYLTAANTANTNILGSGDFTIELWAYPVGALSGTTYATLISHTDLSGSRGFGWDLRLESSTYNVKFYVGTGTAGSENEFLLATNSGITQNSWNHIVITRSSNTANCFVNGVLRRSVAFPATYNLTSNTNLSIGARPPNTPEYLNGYISNARITSGAALYTSNNFTVPTTPLVAGPNTKLLACQSSTFKDNGSNNYSLTSFGNAAVNNSNPFPITYSKFANNVILGTLDEVTNPGPPMRVSNNSSILVKSYFDEINISLSVQYLVIGGGGGGGGHGGGGAGGFRTGYLTSLNVGTNYTVTVGAGGAGATSRNVRGANGNNSVFSAITSAAGGGGGSPGSSTLALGLAGGSGGGGANFGGGASGGTGNIPFVVPPQGTNGGAGAEAYAGGGGGGAGNAGQAGQGNTIPGNGGQGAASSISGNTVVYCGGGGGGGGGGGTSIGSGGSFPSTVGGSKGGAGDGSYQSGVAGGAGTTNTGGGGGGGGRASAGDSNSVGGNGGSGIIILKYPDIYSLSNPGGGLSFSTTSSNEYSITTFTSGTGNIQWSQ
jgi:hypothetical protein